MKFQFNEISQTFPTNSNTAMSECYFGVITTADEGEALVSTHVPNRQRLRHYFGASNSDNRREFHNTESFLKYSQNLKVVRVVNRDIANKRLDFVDNNPPDKSSIGNFYNTEVTDIGIVTTTDSRLTFVEKYPRTDEDISIAICSSDVAWEQEISNEKLNQVISRTIAIPPGAPKNNDMYIVPNSPTGDWVGQSGKYAIWLDDNDTWNFVSVISNDTIFVVDENKEYTYDDSNWVHQDSYYDQFDHIKYKNESAYRVVYDESIQNSFGKIRKWNQMFVEKPNFASGGICVIVFRKVGQRFSLVEKFSTTYSNVGSIDSRYTYAKLGTFNSNKISTYTHSIVETRFEHATNTEMLPTVADYQAAVEVLENDSDVRIIADIEINSQLNIVAAKLASIGSLKILVSGCCDKTRYADSNDIIDDFGVESTPTYYNTTGYENAVAIASMGRSYETREVLPFVGEFAGRLVKNLSEGLMNVAGSRYGRVEDNSGNLIRFNTDDLTRLNQAKIIAIVNDADAGCNIIAGDCMRNRSGISVAYTLLFDVVETAVQKFFDEYAIRCSRLKETEKLKHLLEEKIAEFGVQSDVNYTTVGSEIRFVAKLYYKNIIREIIVNFYIS